MDAWAEYKAKDKNAGIAWSGAGLRCYTSCSYEMGKNGVFGSMYYYLFSVRQ